MSTPPNDLESRERRLHYRFMRRIYRLCRSGRWGLRYVKMSGNHRVHLQVGKELAHNGFLLDAVGCIDPARQIIYIDYRFDVLSTFVHECLHILLDNRYAPSSHAEEELEVRRLEKMIMQHLSPLQAKRLHTEMAMMLHADADDTTAAAARAKKSPTGEGRDVFKLRALVAALRWSGR